MTDINEQRREKNKREYIAKIVTSMTPFEEDMVFMLKGFVDSHLLGAEKPISEEDSMSIAYECLERLKGPEFVDMVYEDYDNFFSYEELRALSFLLCSDAMKKLFTKKKGNPTQKSMDSIYLMAQRVCSEHIFKKKEA